MQTRTLFLAGSGLIIIAPWITLAVAIYGDFRGVESIFTVGAAISLALWVIVYMLAGHCREELVGNQNESILISLNQRVAELEAKLLFMAEKEKGSAESLSSTMKINRRDGSGLRLTRVVGREIY